MSRFINKLTDLQTGEISLVRRGANDKRIALTKSGDDMPLDELFKNVLETEAEGEQALVKTLKDAKVEDEVIEIAKANYRMQHGFKDKLSEETLAVVTKSAGYWTKADDDDDDDDDDEKKPFPGARRPFKSKDKKEKSHVPADMPPAMAAIFKAQQDEVAAVRVESAKIQKQLDDERCERIRKEYVTKCADEYAYVPGMSAEGMGEMLQKAYSVGDEFGKQLEGQWAATSKAVKQSSLLHASGQVAMNSGGGSSPMDKLNTIAKAIETNEKIPFAKAFDKAMTENTDLYNDYLSDNPAQTGRRA